MRRGGGGGGDEDWTVLVDSEAPSLDVFVDDHVTSYFGGRTV